MTNPDFVNFPIPQNVVERVLVTRSNLIDLMEVIGGEVGIDETKGKAYLVSEALAHKSYVWEGDYVIRTLFPREDGVWYATYRALSPEEMAIYMKGRVVDE